MNKIKCNSHANQRELAKILADEGYKVWIEKAEITFGPSQNNSYVVYECKEKGK